MSLSPSSPRSISPPSPATGQATASKSESGVHRYDSDLALSAQISSFIPLSFERLHLSSTTLEDSLLSYGDFDLAEQLSGGHEGALMTDPVTTKAPAMTSASTSVAVAATHATRRQSVSLPLHHDASSWEESSRNLPPINAPLHESLRESHRRSGVANHDVPAALFSSASSSSASVSGNAKKLVRWKDLTSTGNVPNANLSTHSASTMGSIAGSTEPSDGIGSGRIERSLMFQRTSDLTMPTHAAVPSDTKTETLREEMLRWRAKIRKATQVEQRHLDQARDVQSTRLMLQAACDSLRKRLQTIGSAGDSLQTEVESIEEKISSLLDMEQMYYRQSQEIHDRCYRWTQLYQHAARESQRQQQQQCGEWDDRDWPKPIPPLVPCEGNSLVNPSSQQDSCSSDDPSIG